MVNDSRPIKVPAGRFNRFAKLSTMTAGVAGNMAMGAVGALGRGDRPEMRSLLLTPGNIGRITEGLAQMRGAAMKVGQLVSMDTGEFLPPELASVIARLRDQAHFMPPKQLRTVLNAEWGDGWLRHFARFDVRPIAAASIGQVHRAVLKDGREVAIKVQYPGVARSIDSDVSNVGALIRMTGLLPKGFDLAPYLDEARAQLREETDYEREGAMLVRFGDLLAGADDFVLPEFHADWSTDTVLTMSYVTGQPIEDATNTPQPERNRVAEALIRLCLREVFTFGLVQSDPNFANFRYNAETGKIVLLDFGAARSLCPTVVSSYRSMMKAGLEDDAQSLHAALGDLGVFAGDRHDTVLMEMAQMGFDALNVSEVFDFSDGTLVRAMNAKGVALAEAGYVPPNVPMDALYLQRKFAGVFLLCRTLGAKVPLRRILQETL